MLKYNWTASQSQCSLNATFQSQFEKNTTMQKYTIIQVHFKFARNKSPSLLKKLKCMQLLNNCRNTRNTTIYFYGLILRNFIALSELAWNVHCWLYKALGKHYEDYSRS